MLNSRRVQGQADIILREGALYSPGSACCRPGSVAIAGGRIAYAGPDDGAQNWRGPKTDVIDLRGKMVLPGFHDAHLHPLLGGVAQFECDLGGLVSREACLAALQAYAGEHPELPVIRGSGWIYGAFPPAGPHKADLDRVEPGRPVALTAVDGHSLWVNSKALALAGITAATPDPPGGHIERDEGAGEPSGTLREWAAMNLVTRRLPAPSPALLQRGGKAFLDRAARLGITSVGEAMATPALLQAYAALEDRGELTLRVHAAILCEPERGLDSLAELDELRRAYTRRLCRPLAAKLFLDGVVDAHTAFLLEPYIDRPGCRGAPLWPEPLLRQMVTALDRARFQVHVHAVGDAAARLALDAFAVARAANGCRDARHQIAHLDLLDPADIPRFRALGVMANMQPGWFFLDSNYFDSVLPFLGKERGRGLYRLQALLEAGAAVACGSDWPFGGDQVTCDPLAAIQIGATRRALVAEVAEGALPGEAVRLTALLDAYTRGGAVAGFQERETGTLEPGKLADVIVLDRNLLEQPLAEIHRARVLLTLFEGRPVFRDAGI